MLMISTAIRHVWIILRRNTDYESIYALRKIKKKGTHREPPCFLVWENQPDSTFPCFSNDGD